MVIQFDFRHKKLDGDLLLTNACPIECDFCVYSCTASKEPWKWMPENTIRRVAEEYSKNDIGIRISGGEPFYDLQKLERCIDILLEYYKPNELLIITSGVFAFNRKNTEKYINVIKRRDFDTLLLSIDRFHLKRIPFKNVENIIRVCNQKNIEVVLRISVDSLSFPFINKISKLIVKNRLPIEVHGWGIFGRAEKLETSCLKDVDKVKEHLFSKIKKFAEKNDVPTDLRYYLMHTAKRSQNEYASEFFPTTFPNGNVYACSITLKGCYMGNINEENLSDMIFKFKNTLPGHYILSSSNCSYLTNFLPDKFNFRCEICKDKFSINVTKNPEEALGRELVRITAKSDLNKLFEQLLEKKKSVPKKGYEREILISFQLNKNNLNKKIGKKINDFLDKLKINGIRFVLSRPLPPCLEVKIDDMQPKNCFECRELFSVENGTVRYCEPLGEIKGPKLEQVKDRNQIYEDFKIKHDKMKIPVACKNCLFRIRSQCNGMCFVK